MSTKVKQTKFVMAMNLSETKKTITLTVGDYEEPHKHKTFKRRSKNKFNDLHQDVMEWFNERNN